MRTNLSRILCKHMKRGQEKERERENGRRHIDFITYSSQNFLAFSPFSIILYLSLLTFLRLFLSQQASSNILSLSHFLSHLSPSLFLQANFFPSEETALAGMSNIIITLRGKIEFEDTVFRCCRKGEKMLRFFSLSFSLPSFQLKEKVKK